MNNNEMLLPIKQSVQRIDYLENCNSHMVMVVKAQAFKPLITAFRRAGGFLSSRPAWSIK